MKETTKWAHRLTAAKTTRRFTADDRNVVTFWPTCKVGEALADHGLAPGRRASLSLDTRKAAHAFAHAVNTNNVAGALRLATEIDALVRRDVEKVGARC
jgi:hypothetical protein